MTYLSPPAFYCRNADLKILCIIDSYLGAVPEQMRAATFQNRVLVLVRNYVDLDTDDCPSHFRVPSLASELPGTDFHCAWPGNLFT